MKLSDSKREQSQESFYIIIQVWCYITCKINSNATPINMALKILSKQPRQAADKCHFKLESSLKQWSGEGQRPLRHVNILQP